MTILKKPRTCTDSLDKRPKRKENGYEIWYSEYYKYVQGMLA
jgi:hypothetical protein